MKLGYGNLLQITQKWRLVLSVDETGIWQAAANYSKVVVSFIGR